jgi:hypothetical protein
MPKRSFRCTDRTGPKGLPPDEKGGDPRRGPLSYRPAEEMVPGDLPPRRGRYPPDALLDLVDEFRAVVVALEAAEIPFAVCGGLAVAIYAQPRATMDVDLLLPRDQIAGTTEVVRGLGYAIDAGPIVIRPDVVEMHRMSKADEESGDLLSIDLRIVTRELESVWEGRERVGWEHGELPVVSRSGLIRMKRLRGSGQDLDDIRNLEESADGES